MYGIDDMIEQKAQSDREHGTQVQANFIFDLYFRVKGFRIQRSVFFQIEYILPLVDHTDNSNKLSSYS